MTLTEKIAQREKLHDTINRLDRQIQLLHTELLRLDREITIEQRAIQKAEWDAMTPEEQEAKLERANEAIDKLLGPRKRGRK